MARQRECCPTCHQTVAGLREGVRLPRLKAEMFDQIKAAGPAGITSQELLGALKYEHGTPLSIIKSHVHQINDILVETNWRIAADGRGVHARWVLVNDG